MSGASYCSFGVFRFLIFYSFQHLLLWQEVICVFLDKHLLQLSLLLELLFIDELLGNLSGV